MGPQAHDGAGAWATDTGMASKQYLNPMFVPSEMEGTAQSQQGPGAAQPTNQQQVIEIFSSKVDDEALLQELYPSAKRPKMLEQLHIKFWVVIFLVGASTVITGWTEPMNSSEVPLHTFVVCLHLGLLISIALAFFGLTSQTIYVKLGWYVQYFKAFWLFYTSFIIELLLMIAAKTYLLVLLYGNASRMSIWTDRDEGFYPLWIVQQIFLIAFWAVAAYSATTAFDTQWYDPGFFLR